MKNAIIQTLSEIDNFSYENEPIFMAVDKIETLTKELNKLYDMDIIDDPCQLDALCDAINILATIKENLK
jgi:hypothetical protein